MDKYTAILDFGTAMARTIIAREVPGRMPKITHSTGIALPPRLAGEALAPETAIVCKKILNDFLVQAQTFQVNRPIIFLNGGWKTIPQFQEVVKPFAKWAVIRYQEPFQNAEFALLATLYRHHRTLKGATAALLFQAGNHHELVLGRKSDPTLFIHHRHAPFHEFTLLPPAHPSWSGPTRSLREEIHAILQKCWPTPDQIEEKPSFLFCQGQWFKKLFALDRFLRGEPWEIENIHFAREAFALENIMSLETRLLEIPAREFATRVPFPLSRKEAIGSLFLLKKFCSAFNAEGIRFSTFGTRFGQILFSLGCTISPPESAGAGGR